MPLAVRASQLRWLHANSALNKYSRAWSTTKYLESCRKFIKQSNQQPILCCAQSTNSVKQQQQDRHGFELQRCVARITKVSAGILLCMVLWQQQAKSNPLKHAMLDFVRRDFQVQESTHGNKLVTKQFSKLQAGFSEWMGYKATQVFTLNIIGKVCSVIVLALPIIILGGYFYKKFTGVDWKTALFKTYSVLNDAPGADAVAEDSPWANLVLNLVFTVGLFTFAVLLGIVCDDISGRVEEIRSGNYVVLENNHTIVLGWNKLTIPLLQQIGVAQKERSSSFGLPVVVLANLDKDDMDQAIRSSLGEAHPFVITRSGQPYDLSELERISAGQAQTVLLLEGDDGFNERTAATALVGLEACGGGPQKGQIIVLQSTGDDQSEQVIFGKKTRTGLRKNKRGAVVQMHQLKRMQGLMAQCAIQPGLSNVYSVLLRQSQGTPEFYLKAFDNLDQINWAQARRNFNNATLCGYIDSETYEMVMNPKDETVLKPNTQLIGLAQDESQFIASKSVKQLPPLQLSEIKNQKEHAQHIAVLSYGNVLSGLLEELGEFSPKGSQITVVSRNAAQNSIPSQIGNCKVKVINENPDSVETLLEHKVPECDSVVLTGEDLVEQLEDADAQVVSTIIELRYLCEENGRKQGPLHVVAIIRNERIKDIIEQVIHQGAPGSRPKKQGGMGYTSDFISVDLLQPEALNSGLMTQVAAQPALIKIIDELFHAGQVDMFLRDVENFGLKQYEKVLWGQVQEVIRKNGETAIGYLRDQEVYVAPAMSDTLTILPEDKIITIANR